MSDKKICTRDDTLASVKMTCYSFLFLLGITPLFLASRGGNAQLVRALLRKKADPNQFGASQLIAPLHWAAHKENTEIALLLIEYGADIQQKDKVDRTPLSLASRDLAAKMIG